MHELVDVRSECAKSKASLPIDRNALSDKLTITRGHPIMLEWAKRPWQEGLRPLQAKNPHAAGMEAGKVRTADPLAPPLPARSMSEPTGSSSTMASRLSILRLERSLARLNIKRSRSPEKRRAPRAAAQTERKPVPPMLPIPESAQSERKPKARPLDEGRLRRPRGRPISMAYHAAKILVGGDGRAALADEILRHASANFVQEGEEIISSHRFSHSSRRESGTSGRARDSSNAQHAHRLTSSSIGGDSNRKGSLSDSHRSSSASGTGAVSCVSLVSVRQSQTSDDTAQIPQAARAFIGEWKWVRDENYGTFLADCMNLNWAVRKVAEHIHPSPSIRIENGKLVSETSLDVPIKPYIEVLAVGDTTFHEPNQNVDYVVRAVWEGAVFVATRQCDTINGGRPIVSRRWVDDATGELVIAQDWGGKRQYTAFYEMRSPTRRHSI